MKRFALLLACSLGLIIAAWAISYLFWPRVPIEDLIKPGMTLAEVKRILPESLIVTDDYDYCKLVFKYDDFDIYFVCDREDEILFEKMIKSREKSEHELTVIRDKIMGVESITIIRRHRFHFF